ncbi:MAG: tetratricopeptide repeat protein [Chitinophagaceae bacterium]|nr:tetratricopeptide repeat protein [Chitinophagaceae bacterium]
MKKRYFYLFIGAFFVMAASFIIVKFKHAERSKAETFYPLLKAKGHSSEEWKTITARFETLMKTVKTNASDLPSRLALTALFIGEARTTGNHKYYDAAAMKFVDEILEREPSNFEALSFKAMIQLSQHHFAEGIETAIKARALNPHNSFIHAVLVDGYVELGDYAAAIESAEKMITIRPDARSYSRISYLREIHGDYPGAIGAMKLAVDAGPPGDEATEWTRVQLGQLYEHTGDWNNAEKCYDQSLQYRPTYAYALAGKARIATAREEHETAIWYCLQSDSLVNDYAIKAQLARLYDITGENTKARKVYAEVITAMSKEAEEVDGDENVGHYADLELAHLFLETKNNDKAVKHAVAEYNRRPRNIDVNETLAWAYFMDGNVQGAFALIETALRTNSQNPVLLCRAGLIYAKNGDVAKARTLLKKAISSNSNLPTSLRKQAEETFKLL